jgi:hypothetical protein
MNELGEANAEPQLFKRSNRMLDTTVALMTAK